MDRPTARRVLESIRHRGPDGEGEFTDGQVWMGHLRLSILDLSACGRQPMATEDGRFVISYNGEVYNFNELASELRLEALRSTSDTEVVLRSFAALGSAAFGRLNGIFAFAIYDRRRRRLWLVRDRLGVKPLYYRLDDRGLCFGSEIKALLSMRGDGVVCDLSSLHEWLYYGNSLGGRTLVCGIQQLLPGHYLELDIDTFASHTHAYWTLEQQARSADLLPDSRAEATATTRRLLEQAVRRQLVSDVPVGVFLSGGVDSAAITAFATRHYGGRLATYSAGFDDPSAPDERPKARKLAQQYGTDHHELQLVGREMPLLVEKMVAHHDLPFSDAANLPLYLMAAQISATTKVVLQGDGGDELFGGYRRHATMSYYRAMHLAALAVAPLSGLGSVSSVGVRARRYLRAYATPDIATTMARLLTLEDPAERPGLVFTPRVREVFERADPFARYHECQRHFALHTPANQMLLVDLEIQLPDTFLEKVDRSTMAASLEVRVPFLDHDLVDYVVRLPSSRKIPWGRKKYLLKQVLTGIVPDEILYGPKSGFNVPFGPWLRQALKPLFFDHLRSFDVSHPDVLDVAVISALFVAYESGRGDASFLLWKLLNFMIWCNLLNVEISA